MDKQKLKNFKKVVLKAMQLKTEDQLEMFDKIPDEIHSSIFKNNFNENYQLARKIILNKFDQEDYKKIEKEKMKIHDMLKATKHISNKVAKNGETVLFLTDTDNDGSLAQANILAFEKALPEELKNRFQTLYCQTVNGNTARGFTVDLVDLWLEKNPNLKDKPFTIVTADNGINSVEEQIKINKKYPNATLIVTDHHNPDEDNVVVPNENTLVVNPKYKPNKYFQSKNISGANVLGRLLENVLNEFEATHKAELKDKDLVVEHMREISRAANLLDYVDTDITDKPLKDHIVEKYASLGGLMNVNNSLNKIVLTEKTEKEIKDLFSDVEGLDIDKVTETIQKIKAQNVLAEKLITLQYRFSALTNDEKASITKDRIFADMITELDKEKNPNIGNINPNYIEQLRPFIYTYTTSNELLDYEQGILDQMVNVYSTLKKEERVLQAEFGKVNLLNIEKLDNSTIMYPKNSDHLSLLNRKLLGKIYNEENNGMLLTLDNVERERATGSFRSIYRIQDILRNKDKIENLFNVKISFQGHDKAAGFFIEKQDGEELKPEIIEEINKYINKNLNILKEEDKRSYSHLIQTDFDFNTFTVFNAYNKAVKGSLTNMQSLAPVVQFNNHTYLTNSKTLLDESLQQIVKNKKYGYVPASISFDNDTVIIPTELLRQMANSNFKDALQISFMNDGAFIGNKIIPDVNKQKLVKIKKNNKEREKMISFYEEHYKDKHFVELPMKYIKESPFFAANKFGESEYTRYESTVISILDETDSDMIVVADVEANGLGSAPKICNLGTVELSIDENSGNFISPKLFEERAFKSITGKHFMLSKAQLSDVEEITKKEYNNLNFAEKQMTMVMLEDESRYFKVSSFDKFKSLNNFSKKNGGVHINRGLKASMGSVFINDNDVKITEKIATLTAIDNTLLNKIGMSSKKADEIFTERYKDKKIIFQAHNLPYDLGVLRGNLNELYKLVTDIEKGNKLNDSAIYSRSQKLAYDPINIATFEKDMVPALYGKEFFHSEASDFAINGFLSSPEDGMLPDRTGRHFLKKKDGKVTIIDTKENVEVTVEVARASLQAIEDERVKESELMGVPKDEIEKVDISELSVLDLLQEQIKVIDMPGNSIKYSVQSLSDYDMIRSMILSSADFQIKSVDIPEEFENATEKMEFFMMNYHFDASFKENFSNFQSSLDANEISDMFVTAGFKEAAIEEMKEEFVAETNRLKAEGKIKRARKVPDFSDKTPEDPKIEVFNNFAAKFLEENKDLQKKFHETWVYKRVLNAVNPTKEKLKDKDLVGQIAYVTAISEDVVEKIMKEAIEYKEKYNLDSVIQKEPHNNLYFDKCDVAMEAVLTFKRPTDRNYNTYNHSTKNVVNMYLENIAKTTYKNMEADLRTVALDSYSRKQAASYKRVNKTDFIKRSVESDIEHVKFKFSADTLQQHAFAYGVLKRELTDEEIDNASEKLEFIVRNEQMRNSVYQQDVITEADEEFVKTLNNILDRNEGKVNEYRKEMEEFFEEIYFSKKENEMHKCLKLVEHSILTGESIKTPRMGALMKREKESLIDLTAKFSDIAMDLGVSQLKPFIPTTLGIGQSDKIDQYLGKTIDDIVSAPKEEDVDQTLMNFFAKIQEKEEISIEEKLEEELKFLNTLHKGNETAIAQDLLKSKIIKSVNIKRQNNAKQIFKFSELLNEKLGSILRGEDQSVDFEYKPEVIEVTSEMQEKIEAGLEKVKSKPKRKPAAKKK